MGLDFRALGRKLHYQIVVPLMAASLIVAVVATFVAVFLLSRVIERWVDEENEGASRSVAVRVADTASHLQRDAKLLADDSRITGALSTHDLGMVAGALVLANNALALDEVMVLDASGRVLASTGDTLGIEPGDRPLPARFLESGSIGMAFASFTPMGGKQTVTAVQPIWDRAGEQYLIAASTVVSDQFLGRLTAGIEGTFCYYDASKRYYACSGHDAGAPPEVYRRLERDDPAVLKAIDAVGTGRRSTTLKSGGRDFRVWAQSVTLPGDPTRTNAYLVAVVDTELERNALTTTARLIVMWSLLAVAVLAVIGRIVASRVSRPLLQLAEGARRVAEGDFSYKVATRGSNEIADLARNFNQMTDSLKERTEVLTKKVLELATLYEMSRSLGSTLDLDVLLGSVLDSAMRIFDVELGYVTLRDKQSGQLELRVWRGAGVSSDDDEALRNSMSEWVVREGRPLIFNPSQAVGYEQQVDAVTGALAALCVPLVSSEGTIGALTVGSKDEGFRFSSDDVRLLSTIANHVTIAIGNIELFSSLQDAYLATVRALAAAVDAKDTYTRGHSDNVASFALTIAESMDLSAEQRTALEMAAYLHDIGKIGVKEEILLKPGRLSDAEMGQMRHHPLIGANILKPVAFPWPIAPIIRHHHERWDGGGYPAGLRGEEIPLLARVLTVADAFEAMTSDRPYRSGRARDEAVEELRRCAGTHFDAKVVDAFVSAMEKRERHEEKKRRTPGSIQTDEVRAIFVAVCDGMFASFRRLGGPRLASNLEAEVNDRFRCEDCGMTFIGGHMRAEWPDTGLEEELDLMRTAVRHLGELMQRTTGPSLVEHFYTEALGGLSERMRALATELRLFEQAAA